MVRLTDRPDMTLDVYCGRKITMQQQQQQFLLSQTTDTSKYFLGPENLLSDINSLG